MKDVSLSNIGGDAPGEEEQLLEAGFKAAGVPMRKRG
jgi:hypothetical protein